MRATPHAPHLLIPADGRRNIMQPHGESWTKKLTLIAVANVIDPGTFASTVVPMIRRENLAQ
ncbi:MAG: hypothetical protein IH987_01825 [Planctomycetes bacterium]|nr:hypothetical protein [Planctomycetota bacterium]